MPTTDTDDDTDEPTREHRYDVFDVGDEIPWWGDHATVLSRVVVDPDEALFHADDEFTPGEYQPPMRDDTDARAVLLELELPETTDPEETITVTACGLYRRLSSLAKGSTGHGHPTVHTNRQSTGVGAQITISVPSVGARPLTESDARQLASFLEGAREWDALRVLLGGADSPEDVDKIANALRQAADVMALIDRADDEGDA